MDLQFAFAIWPSRNIGAILTWLFVLAFVVLVIAFFAAAGLVILIVCALLDLGWAGYWLGKRSAAFMRGHA